MTCGTACAQTTADTAMAAYEKGKPYTRYEIMNALYLDGGSALYLVSDQLIPDAEKTIRTPYGETLPVLHLKRKHCTEDGVTLHKADWAGVGPGTYLEDRAFLIVEVFGDAPITEAESRRPRERLVQQRRFTVRPLGTIKAEWEYRDGAIHRKHYAEDPVVTGTTTEAQAEQAYKTRLEKLLAALMEALR